MGDYETLLRGATHNATEAKETSKKKEEKKKTNSPPRCWGVTHTLTHTHTEQKNFLVAFSAKRLSVFPPPTAARPIRVVNNCRTKRRRKREKTPHRPPPQGPVDKRSGNEAKLIHSVVWEGDRFCVCVFWEIRDFWFTTVEQRKISKHAITKNNSAEKIVIVVIKVFKFDFKEHKSFLTIFHQIF